jgi:uncharacterized protein (TIGR03437 family)
MPEMILRELFDWAAALVFVLTAACGIAFAQSNPCQTTQPVSTLGSAPVAQATIVYDPNQGVCWLANANLAANAAMQTSLGVAGINPNGSMDYATALRWVAALNAYNNGSGYLGHSNWQLPVAALVDKTCDDIGTNGGSFGPQCTGSALGNLYSSGLKLVYPASVAPGLAGSVPPLHNLKASYYWALHNNGGTSGTDNGGQEMFSFANGIQGGTTINDTYYYTLPMVAGAIGTAPSCPAGAGVVAYTSGPASGNAVYDCNTGYTWPADANLAASNAFGITGNLTIAYNNSRTITAPQINGGAMLVQTAIQWIQAMNTAKYLGSASWEMPATWNTLQGLFNDLNITPGDTRLMWTGTLGPFENLQPFFYWACGRNQSGNSQSPCDGYSPAGPTAQLQWSYVFDYGLQATSSLIQKYFVMVYSPATPPTGPVVSLVANAEGEGLTIAPNTWVEIKGSNLAPSGDSHIWQSSDFTGGKMPASLDGVSTTVNGVSAYVYYISPTQINILTPPDALPAYPQIVVTNNGVAGAPFAALGQTLALSFFVFGDDRNVAAIHLDGSLVGPVSLSVPGYAFTPAQPGETISVYANGFGATTAPVASGSVTQGGVLSPLPTITIGGKNAVVQYAGLISPGLFQFNIVVPGSLAAGQQPIVATYSGASTQPGTLLSVHP